MQLPPAPTVSDTDPDSPANDNTPLVKGTAEAGTTVRIYATTNCSGAPLATGTAAEFASPGIEVSVTDNTVTTFRATVVNGASAESLCSTSSVTYTEDSAAPPAPTVTDTDPDSPANENSPEVKGEAAAAPRCGCTSPRTARGPSRRRARLRSTAHPV